MEEAKKYGSLFEPSIKLRRQYFREAVKLLGIYVFYRSPKRDKQYTTYAEIDSNYNPPILIGCLFHEHPNQKTLRKIGWMSELQQDASLIEVDYDLENLQQGSLFIVPSGLDDGKSRTFRVVSMQTSMQYPSSITCEIVPEYQNTFIPESYYDYSDSSFTLLNREDEKEVTYVKEY